jgi:hypothetical protein
MSRKCYSGTFSRLLLTMKNLAAIDHLQAFVSFTLLRNCICKTLEIFLPARIPKFFHSLRG